MGLHAGLYTQQLPNQGRSLARNEDVTHSEAVSLSWRECLKNVPNRVTCPQCQQKFIPDGSLSEWLGEREEGS